MKISSTSKFLLFILGVLCFGLSFPTRAQETMRANLYTLASNGTTHLMDGNMTNYSSIYSNLIDAYDAIKLENPGTNFGIFRLNTNLSVERRQALPANDTTCFKMWNMGRQDYRLMLVLSNFNCPNTIGYLYDNYLNVEVPVRLNDTTCYDFSVNSDPASSNIFRFKLVYAPKQSRIYMPVIWEASLNHTWSSGIYPNANKVLMENSTDGIHFLPIRPNNPVSNNENEPLKYNRGEGTMYFRAKFNSDRSDIAANPQKISGIPRSISVFPNPVTGKEFSLRLFNQPAGTFRLNLVGTNGSVYMLPELSVNTERETMKVNLPQTLAPGIYQLQVIAPDRSKSVISLSIK